MRNPKKKVRRPKPRIRRDGEKEKYYPNSISLTALAIQQFWLRAIKPNEKSRLGHKEFCEQTDFVETYERVVNRYRADKKPATRTTIASMVNDIAVGRGQIQYYRLRTFANFVGLPTGLFLLFTHCVGDQLAAEEKRKRDPHAEDSYAACMKLIEAVMLVAQETKSHIEQERASNGQLFMHCYDDDPNLRLPNVKLLKSWADLYKSKTAES